MNRVARGVPLAARPPVWVGDRRTVLNVVARFGSRHLLLAKCLARIAQVADVAASPALADEPPVAPRLQAL